jgi:hypothetical protein
LLKFAVEGIRQDELDMCVEKIEAIQRWATRENLDRWALRAALLKALDEDAEQYFLSTNGNYREIAAFDNGVAIALESSKKK